jgi:hypothetical protein
MPQAAVQNEEQREAGPKAQEGEGIVD